MENNNLSYLVQEKELRMAGMVELNPAKQFTKLLNIKLGANIIINSIYNDLITFNIRIVNLSTGSVLYNLYRECYSESEIISTVKSIVNLLELKYFKKCGKLKIITKPSNVSVFINNDYITTTPALITDIEKGNYKVMLKKANYQIKESNINILPRITREIYLTLERIEKKYYRLGLKEEKRGRFQKAIIFYKKFISIYKATKESLDALYRIAHIYQYEIKDYDKAIKYYQKIIKSYPDVYLTSESYYGVGECLYMKKRIAEAKEIFREILEEYPETSAAEYTREKYINEKL
jgi:tetratricopeptide (TPR) repeat protein